MRCNHCGKEIQTENQVAKEGVAEIVLHWGYFSNKDGETHRICLCEDCYDQWVKEFAVPVLIEEDTELL